MSKNDHSSSEQRERALARSQCREFDGSLADARFADLMAGAAA